MYLRGAQGLDPGTLQNECGVVHVWSQNMEGRSKRIRSSKASMSSMILLQKLNRKMNEKWKDRHMMEMTLI